MAYDASYKPKYSYILVQVAHIVCKKSSFKRFFLQLFLMTSLLLMKHCKYLP